MFVFYARLPHMNQAQVYYVLLMYVEEYIVYLLSHVSENVSKNKSKPDIVPYPCFWKHKAM